MGVRNLLLISLVLSISLNGYSRSRKPIWVEKGYHPRYHEKLYFIGIGIAKNTGDREKDIRRADDSARSEIAKQIRVNVQEKIQDIMKQKGQRGEVSTDIEVLTKSNVEMTLEGVKIAERYYDKKSKTYYSLAVLDRESASSSLLSTIKKSIGEINRLLKGSASLSEKGNCWTALSYIARSSVLLNKVENQTAILKVLSDSPMLTEYRPPSNLPTPTYVESFFEKVMDRLKIEKTSGDNQTGEVGMPLPDPFVVRVLCSEKPEKGVPIKAYFKTGKGDLEEKTITSSSGKAKMRLQTVQDSGVEKNTVIVTFNADKLRKVDSADVSQELIDRIESKLVYFTYTVPTKRIMNFAVIIKEFNLDEPVDPPIIAPEITNALVERGFRIIDKERAGKNLSGIDLERPDAKKVASRFSGVADVVVIGKVKSRFSSKVMDGFYFARASGVLKAIRIRDGKVIVSKRVEEKGGGNSVEQAGFNAINELKRKLIEEFSSALDTSF